MTSVPYKTAVVIGAGAGISGSVARQLARAGLRVAAVARDIEKLKPLSDETGALLVQANVSDPQDVERLFAEVDGLIGPPEVVVFNASGRVLGPIIDLDPEQARRAIEVSTLGGLCVVQQAAKRMVPLGRGAILLTGATASVKGFANSSVFAIGKFGLRGLAQSAARELGPKGIHVAHFVIDGNVRSATRPDPRGSPDSTLDPEAIAASYLAVLSQPRNAWCWELELRPWVESF
ncbi:SDR family oxidoreductase [soil metagenome]